MEINVEEIMAQIRQEIKDKGYTADMLSFRDESGSFAVVLEFDNDVFTDTVGHIEMTKYVPWKQEIAGNGLKSVAKKIVQKLIGPILAPASDGQNIFNQQVAEAFEQLLGYIAQQNKCLEEYKEKIDCLQKELEKQSSGNMSRP